AFPVHCVSTVAHPGGTPVYLTESNSDARCGLTDGLVLRSRHVRQRWKAFRKKSSIRLPHGWAGFLKMLHRGLARQNMTNFGGSRKLNSPATRAMTQNPNTARMKMPPQKYSTQSITPAPRTITSIRRKATR